MKRLDCRDIGGHILEVGQIYATGQSYKDATVEFVRITSIKPHVSGKKENTLIYFDIFEIDFNDCTVFKVDDEGFCHHADWFNDFTLVK